MSAAKQISWSAISSLLGAFLDIAKISLMARFLAPENFGTFAIAMVVMGFCQLFSEGGVGNAIVSKKNISPKQAGHILNFNLLIALIITILVALLLPLITHFYPLPDLSEVILLLMISLPFAGAARIFQAMLQRELKIVAISKVTMIAKVCSLSAALLAVYFNLGVYALPVSAIVFAICNCLLLYLLSANYICLVKTIKWHYIQPILSFSIFQLGEFLLNFFAKNLDILLITKFYSADVAGVYSVSKNLLMRVGDILMTTFVRYFHPTLAKLQDKPQALSRQYLCFFRIVCIFSVISYLLVALNAQLAVTVLLGENFAQAKVLFPFICLWLAIRFCTAPVATLWLVKQLPQLGLIWNIAVAILTPIVMTLAFKQGIEALLSSLIGLQILFLSVAIFLTYYLLKPAIGAHIVQSTHLIKLFIISLSAIYISHYFHFTPTALLAESAFIMIVSAGYLWQTRDEYLGEKV